MIPLILSPLLSQVDHVRHGFTTREGGVSEGPYRSLNLGLGQAAQDAPGAVEANHVRLREQLDARSLVTVKQVHGVNLVQVKDARRDVEADGILTNVPGDHALILVADCAPVLLARRDSAMVGAVHAGWRGAVAGIASRAVALMGTSDVVVAIGPCIGPCCFEVGPEVAEAAAKVGGSDVVIPRAGGNPHVDLAGIVAADLEKAGVSARHIDILRICTRCTSEFFSHRRDHGVTGRQAGLIGLTR